MQFTLFCRDFDLVAKYAFSQAPSCTNFLQPGSASDSRTGKWSVPYHQLKTGHNLRFKRYDQIVFCHFFSFHILFLAFIFESSDQCDKRCVVTTTKLGLGNSRHTQPPSSGCLPPQPINCGQSETRGKESVKYLRGWFSLKLEGHYKRVGWGIYPGKLISDQR